MRKCRNEEQYFIDRNGKIHKFKGETEDIISVHAEIARQLYPKMQYPNDAEDYIMKQGWIMIGSSCYTHPIIHKKPTQAQINTLDKLGKYKRLTFLHKGFYENYDKYQILCDK